MPRRSTLGLCCLAKSLFGWTPAKSSIHIRGTTPARGDLGLAQSARPLCNWNPHCSSHLSTTPLKLDRRLRINLRTNATLRFSRRAARPHCAPPIKHISAAARRKAHFTKAMRQRLALRDHVCPANILVGTLYLMST
jgi:hypothetical protein